MDRDGGVGARQSLGRALTAEELGLADAMEAIFATRTHDFELVAEQLNNRGVVRPSGLAGAWTLTVLEEELRRTNRSLDDAYDGRAPLGTSSE